MLEVTEVDGAGSRLLESRELEQHSKLHIIGYSSHCSRRLPAPECQAFTHDELYHREVMGTLKKDRGVGRLLGNQDVDWSATYPEML